MIEKKRLVGELRRFTKRPTSNFIETDILKKTAQAEIYCTTNEQI